MCHNSPSYVQQHSTEQHSTAQHSTTACRTNRSPAIDSLFCTPIRANLPHLNRKQKEHLQCPGQLQLLHHLDKGAGVIPHACLIARTQLELTHKGGQLRPVTDQQGCQCQAITQIAVKVGHPLCRSRQCLHHSKLVVSESNRGRTVKPSSIDSPDSLTPSALLTSLQR